MDAQIFNSIKNYLPVSLFKTSETEQESFPMTSEVVNLGSFQMNSIYHHINSGSELSLRYNFDAKQPHLAVEVFFKSFKLGHLPYATANIIEKVLMHGFELKVKVTEVVKRKYMPTRELKIVINDNELAY